MRVGLCSLVAFFLSFSWVSSYFEKRLSMMNVDAHPAHCWMGNTKTEQNLYWSL